METINTLAIILYLIFNALTSLCANIVVLYWLEKAFGAFKIYPRKQQLISTI